MTRGQKVTLGVFIAYVGLVFLMASPPQTSTREPIQLGEPIKETSSPIKERIVKTGLTVFTSLGGWIVLIVTGA